MATAASPDDYAHAGLSTLDNYSRAADGESQLPLPTRQYAELSVTRLLQHISESDDDRLRDLVWYGGRAGIYTSTSIDALKPIFSQTQTPKRQIVHRERKENVKG